MTRYVNLTRAEAAGALTEIRRPVKPQPYCPLAEVLSSPRDGSWRIFPKYCNPHDEPKGWPMVICCPFGKPVDVLVGRVWFSLDRKHIEHNRYRVLSVRVERAGDKWEWVAKVEPI